MVSLMYVSLLNILDMATIYICYKEVMRTVPIPHLTALEQIF